MFSDGETVASENFLEPKAKPAHQVKLAYIPDTLGSMEGLKQVTFYHDVCLKRDKHFKFKCCTMQ